MTREDEARTRESLARLGDPNYVGTFEQRRRDEFDRAIQLQERQVAAQEQLAKLQHEIKGDTAIDRFGAFWELPKWQQEFRLREECVGYAVTASSGSGHSPTTIINTAKALQRYIVNGE